MKKIKIAVLFYLVIIFSNSMFSGDRRGPEWLNYTIGARANALGQAFAAFADDATTAFNNPGGLPNLFVSDSTNKNKLWLSTTYALMPSERHLAALSTSFKVSKLILGVSAIYTNGINERDSFRNTADNQRDYAWMPVISIATVLPDNETISFGGNIKFFSEKSDGVKSTGMVFDFGSYIQIVNMISLGVVVKNIGYVNYENQAARFIAPVVKIGMGYNPPGRRNFALCLHIEKDTGREDSPFIGSGGLFVALWSKEYISGGNQSNNPLNEDTGPRKKRKVYFNAVYVNLGFHGREFSCGLTVNIFTFKIDYAFIINNTENNEYTHVFTLEKRF